MCAFAFVASGSVQGKECGTRTRSWRDTESNCEHITGAHQYWKPKHGGSTNRGTVPEAKTGTGQATNATPSWEQVHNFHKVEKREKASPRVWRRHHVLKSVFVTYRLCCFACASFWKLRTVCASSPAEKLKSGEVRTWMTCEDPNISDQMSQVTSQLTIQKFVTLRIHEETVTQSIQTQ